jgi:hypothetical protein
MLTLRIHRCCLHSGQPLISCHRYLATVELPKYVENRQAHLRPPPVREDLLFWSLAQTDRMVIEKWSH